MRARNGHRDSARNPTRVTALSKYSTQFCFNAGTVVQFEAVTKILQH